MSSTPKRRVKPKLDPPPPSSSRSPLHPLTTLEPPSSFFPSREELLKLVAVLAIASAVAVSCSFFAGVVNPRAKPFCDSDTDSTELPISDSCEPCPSHGECRQGELECVWGYRKQGRTCVEDRDINDTAKQLSEWVETRLCEAYAQLLCGGAGTAWVEEADILNDLDGQLLMRNFGGDPSLLMYTKIRAMETIVKLLEARGNPAGMKEFKCPDTLAEYYKPYSCRIREWIFEHALLLLPVCSLLLGFMVLIRRIRKKRNLSSRVEELYHQVCDILEENALMSKEGTGEPWVVAARLRDHVLLPKERKDPSLWKKVEELVQEDSRIDRYPKLVKGEQKVVWEWQVEGSLSYSKVKKKSETDKSKSPEDRNANYQHRELRSVSTQRNAYVEPRASLL